MADTISTWVVLTLSLSYAGEMTPNGNSNTLQRIFCRRSNAPPGLPSRSWIDTGDGHCGYEIVDTYWHEHLNALVYYVRETISPNYREGEKQSAPADHQERFDKFCNWYLNNGWQLGDIHQVIKPQEVPMGYIPSNKVNTLFACPGCGANLELSGNYIDGLWAKTLKHKL